MKRKDGFGLSHKGEVCWFIRVKAMAPLYHLADGIELLPQFLQLTAINNLDWLGCFAT